MFEKRELCHQGTVELISERLKLRKFKVEDAEHMYKNWANDSEVTKFLSWQIHESVDETRDLLKSWEEASLKSDNYNWAIELIETGEVIGSIGVVSISEQNSSCEIGYALGRDFWRKGIMTEALTLVTNFLFGEVNFNRIMLRHNIHNPGSGGVMEKSGYKKEGVFRGADFRDDYGYCDMLLYSMLRNEWETARS